MDIFWNSPTPLAHLPDHSEREKAGLIFDTGWGINHWYLTHWLGNEPGNLGHAIPMDLSQDHPSNYWTYT